jgi:hypothetical protein
MSAIEIHKSTCSGAADAFDAGLGEAHPLVRLGEPVQIDGDVGEVDGGEALGRVVVRLLGGVERVAPGAIGAVIIAGFEAQLAEQLERFGGERAIADRGRDRRHLLGDRQALRILSGGEPRPRAREVRAFAGDLRAQLGIRRLRRHLRQRLHVRARRDRRQRLHGLHGVLDRVVVGGREQSRQRAQVLPTLIETRHAQRHHRLGLLAAQARRLAGVAVHRHERRRVIVEPAQGRVRHFRRVRLAALGERRAQRRALRVVPDARESLRAARADASAARAPLLRAHDERRRRSDEPGAREPTTTPARRIAPELGQERAHRRPARRRIDAQAA